MPVLATLSSFGNGDADGAGSDSATRVVQEETAALADGVDYLVLFEGGAIMDGGVTGTVCECDVQFGSTVYAYAQGFSALGFDAPEAGSNVARCAGAFIVTGDGSDTVSIGTRRIGGSAGQEVLWSGGGVKAIPIDSLDEGENFWQSAEANSDTATVTPASASGWVEFGTAVEFEANTTGEHLVIFSGETQFQSDAGASDVMRVRFRLTTDPNGSPTTVTLSPGDNSGELSPAMHLYAPASDPENFVRHFRFDEVVDLTSGTEYRFFMEVEALSGGGDTEYRRGRIQVFDEAPWVGGFIQDEDTAGAQESAPGPAVFGPLNIPDPTPDTHEYTFLGGTTFANNDSWNRLVVDLNGTNFPEPGGFGAAGFNNGAAATDDLHWLSMLAEDDVSVASYTVNMEGEHDNADCPYGQAHGSSGGPPTMAAILTRIIGWRMETSVYRIDGQSDGAATVTGTLSGEEGGNLDGQADGAATATGALTNLQFIDGQADGAATSSGALSGTGALAGQADGVAVGSATPLASTLMATVAGSATATGTLLGSGELEAAADGQATGTGTLLGAGELAGQADAAATVTGAGTSVIQATTTADPLAQYDDSFVGSSLGPQWSVFNASVIDRAEVANGEINLEPTQGGAAGSLWFNTSLGMLHYVDITGGFDVRARMRVRDSAGTASPPGDPGDFRFAGIAAHDPDRTAPATDHNYVHVMLGGDPNGQNRIEWKTTDASVSEFASDAGSAPLDYDIRLVRDQDDNQIFRLYYRRTDLGETLASDTGWVLLQTVDRTDSATPPRASAVSLPALLQVGFVGGYANPVTHDIQSWVEEIRYRTGIPETASGRATAVATATGVGALQASVSAGASASGSLDGAGSLAAVSAAAASSAGTLTATGDLAGQSDGAATSAAAGLARVVGAAQADGLAAANGTATGGGRLAVVAVAAAVVVGVLTGSGALAGTDAGAATGTGALLGTAAADGQSDGTASTAGAMLALRRGTANVAGVAAVSGMLLGDGRLEAVAAGSAMSRLIPTAVNSTLSLEMVPLIETFELDVLL